MKTSIRIVPTGIVLIEKIASAFYKATFTPTDENIEESWATFETLEEATAWAEMQS